MVKQMEHFNETSITKNEFNNLKELFDKELRMIRHRVFQQERDIKKIDTFIENQLPLQMDKITSDMNEIIDK